jgi:hypothetical protein
MREDELDRRRRTRLRDELLDAHVRLDFGGEDGARLIEEIDYARYPPRHERSFPRYGAIVLAGPPPPEPVSELLPGAVIFPGGNCSVSDLRRLADGQQSFLLRSGSRSDLVLLPSPSNREVDLVRVRRRLGPAARVVQRGLEGTVRLLGGSAITVWDGTHWWTKPYADQYARAVQRSAPSCGRSTLTAILDFCVHSLGPAPFGAILVWALDHATSDRIRVRNRWRAPHSLPALSLQHPLAHGAIRHLLAQVDGATLIAPDGRLLETGFHLQASPSAHELVHIPRGRGTRHAAGKRFSYDESRTILFVVSEDGPVTVFSDGATVASIELRAATLETPTDGEGGQGPRRRLAVLECVRCLRSFAVAQAVIPALESTTVACPVCGTAAEPPWPNADPRTWVLKRM